jgi:hypothetical protein
MCQPRLARQRHWAPGRAPRGQVVEIVNVFLRQQPGEGWLQHCAPLSMCWGWMLVGHCGSGGRPGALAEMPFIVVFLPKAEGGPIAEVNLGR